MLDDYSLRLLTEIGVDVYVPRGEVAEEAPPASASIAAQPTSGRTDRASSEQSAAVTHADVLLLCAEQSHPRLLADLLRSLRMSRLKAAIASSGQADSIEAARALIVLGESLARSLGADMPAQRQNAISWIVSHEPKALAQSADAKRALWGEIKRLSRSQVRRPTDA
ncbi:MAG TPA: hypothetical protein VFN25_00535 [Dokdonella sp.]|uniref:hypothetical protein n=1 Tax=Dokdonella sp. TaxID=2291710 RepID=UPI002D8049A7|nr:hypothetical protein [Dokdonella sp.]HET9031366.1 hypothetical protein [Dokdonella sp.]